MIIIEKCPIVPLFLRANEDGNHYNNHSVDDFSLNEADYFSNEYFLEYEYLYYELIGESKFSLDSYIDIVCAPFAVFGESRPDEASYPEVLKKVFLQLFPSPEQYKTVLLTYFGEVERYLLSVERKKDNKNDLVQSLTLVKDKVQKEVNDIKKTPVRLSTNEYVSVSNTVLQKLAQHIDDLLNKALFTPPDIIEGIYYYNHPSYSWKEDPLAYFRTLMFGNSLCCIKEQWEFEAEQYGDDVDEVPDYLMKIMEREANITFRLFSEKLKSTISEASKNELITRWCQQLAILYERSLQHEIKNICEEGHLIPYRWLIRNLKMKFPVYKCDFPYHYEKEEKQLPIDEIDFIKKLLKLEVEIKDEILSLCNEETKPTYFGYFIKGDLAAIPISINFNFPKQTVYYLIILLLENGSSFSGSHRLIRKKVLIQGGPFNYDSFRSYKSQLMDGKTKKLKEDKPRYAEIIDNLFSVNNLKTL